MRNVTIIAVLFSASLATAAASFDVPKRKSGLWEIKVTHGEGPGAPQTIQKCIDENTDDFIGNNRRDINRSCSKAILRKEGDKIVAESVCKVDKSTVTSREVVTGRFNSAYRIDIKSTYEPPFDGIKESTTTMDAKWLGACKPGQKAGDIFEPGLPTINVNDRTKNMPNKP